MSELIYPTIDLFIYDIRDALNTTDEEIKNNLTKFQSKLPPNNQLVDSTLETEYLELLPQKKTIDFETKYEDKSLKGYYYPVRLNDTYALQIDCSIENKIVAQPINSFKLIKETIEQQLNKQKETLGKTWLISGCLKNSAEQTHEKIAKDSYNTLFPDYNWQKNLQEKISFFDGELFELWHNDLLTNNTHHVIIIIYSKIENEQKIANLSIDLIGLFCYQHKIFWAYNQSRTIKESLLKFYRKIESTKQKLNKKHLKIKLDDIQEILEDYTVDLPKLNIKRQILEINLINYKRRLKIIKNKLNVSENTKVFNKFINLSYQKYRLQIIKDQENMELGLKLLESNINIIRSQIEAEKAKRDRNFQNLVTLVGTGTALMALIDDEGKKCKAITEVMPNQFIERVCDSNFGEIVAFPIIMIFILGCLGLGAKAILAKLN
ncbi:MAG: hypothetical protein QNJ33_00605 [Crocosphaera sp.]|nr:hypothetical protein [Crocosphaera sp.]